MGLLDRVRSLLDGSDGGGHGGSSDDPPDGAGGNRRDGPAVQSHGSHWDTVLPDEGRGGRLEELTTRAVETGEPIEGHPHEERAVTGHRLDDGPLGVLSVSLDGMIATAYPVAEGVEHPMTMEALKPWESGVEA
ncbi:hypothetical protein BRD17_01110 [Halobacteriales archaeon SW_7_68_16]|nr:MAG: hypothetical protein BRD17_01110 [Halobacteriales archaeon SW_7_68_16]